jgi:hypothetical protein
VSQTVSHPFCASVADHASTEGAVAVREALGAAAWDSQRAGEPAAAATAAQPASVTQRWHSSPPMPSPQRAVAGGGLGGGFLCWLLPLASPVLSAGLPSSAQAQHRGGAGGAKGESSDGPEGRKSRPVQQASCEHVSALRKCARRH